MPTGARVVRSTKRYLRLPASQSQVLSPWEMSAWLDPRRAVHACGATPMAWSTPYAVRQPARTPWRFEARRLTDGLVRRVAQRYA
jgi:hypothetical protein